MAGIVNLPKKPSGYSVTLNLKPNACAKQTIGTEHLFLGLMIEEGTIAKRVLKDLGLDLATVRKKVEEETGFGTGSENLTLR